MNYEALSVLADRIVANEDVDLLEGYAAIRPFLNRLEAAMLAGMLEICPIHVRDEGICRDDRPEECAHLYGRPECGVTIELGSRHDPYSASCERDQGHDGAHSAPDPFGVPDVTLDWTGGGRCAGDPLPYQLV